MNLLDIIGPVMVGPSSSHTAGAVRIGYVARQLLGEEVREAKILLYGSFLATDHCFTINNNSIKWDHISHLYVNDIVSINFVGWN